MCSWDVLSSFFQLFAALAFGYAVGSTSFLKGVDMNLFQFYKRNISSLRKHELEKYTAQEKVQRITRFLDKHIPDQKLEEANDAVIIEVERVRRNYTIFFFFIFLTCISFLVLAGFENYYLKKLPIDASHEIIEETHSQFCKLMIINFSILWVFPAFTWVVAKKKKKVVEELKLKEHRKKEPFKLIQVVKGNYFRIAWIIVWVFIFNESLQLPLEKGFMANYEHFRIIFLFCVLSILLPFLQQILNVRLNKKPYFSYLSDLFSLYELDDKLSNEMHKL